MAFAGKSAAPGGQGAEMGTSRGVPRMWRANVSYQIYNVLLLIILLATVARPKTWIAMYESAEGKTSDGHAHKPRQGTSHEPALS